MPDDRGAWHMSLITSQQLQDYVPAGRDDREKALLPLIHAAAEQAVVGYLGRQIEAADRTEYRGGIGGPQFWLSNPPYVSDLAVSVGGTAVPCTVVDPDAGWVRRDSGVFNIQDIVKAEYRAGYAADAIPSAIQLGVLHLCAREWHRLRVEGQGAVMTETKSDETGTTSRRLDGMAVDGPTRLLLDPFRLSRPV